MIPTTVTRIHTFLPKNQARIPRKGLVIFFFLEIARKSVLQGMTIFAHQSLWKIKMLQWLFFRYCFKYLRSLRRYYPSIGSTRMERNAYRIVLNNNKKLSPSKFFLSKVLLIKSCISFFYETKSEICTWKFCKRIVICSF